MERLTERDEYGNADLIGVDTARLAGLGANTLVKIVAALNRLAAYEDTGFDPYDAAMAVFDETAYRRIAQAVIRHPVTVDQIAEIAEIIAPALSITGCFNNKKVATDLRALAIAYAENRAIILPCKLRTPVFRLSPAMCDHRDNDTCSAYCDGYDYSCPSYQAESEIIKSRFGISDIHEFGKTVFLTREEAEKTLEAKKGADDARNHIPWEAD